MIDAEPSGILLVDKPSGPTSRRVAEDVGRLLGPIGRRRRGGPRFRAGHAGTLDPLATGLLVVLVGRGTRLQPFLQGLDKRYLATVRFGVGTDSLDRDGEVTGRSTVPAVADGLEAALAALSGSTMQVPPLISALKRDGRSLHERVRKGEDVEPPSPRPVRILSLDCLALRWGASPPPDEAGFVADDGLVYEADLDIVCGSGTYVRSLARDVAAALGTLGHVHALRRLEVGPFAVADALTLEDLAARDRVDRVLMPLSEALPHVPAFTMTAEQAARLRQGVQPEPGWLPAAMPELFRLMADSGSLVAVGRLDPDTGAPRTVAVFPAPGSDQQKDDPCG